MNIIQELELEQIKSITAKRGVPEFGPGDTLTVRITQLGQLYGAGAASVTTLWF